MVTTIKITCDGVFIQSNSNSITSDSSSDNSDSILQSSRKTIITPSSEIDLEDDSIIPTVLSDYDDYDDDGGGVGDVDTVDGDISGGGGGGEKLMKEPEAGFDSLNIGQ